MSDLNLIVNGARPSLLNRNRIILAPIAVGKHTAKLISLEEKLAKNGKPFVNAELNCDNEPANRTRSLFEVEFGMFCAGLATQMGMLGKSESEVLNYAQTTGTPFTFWIVEVENQEDPDHPYLNWVYSEPRQSASTRPDISSNLPPLV